MRLKEKLAYEYPALEDYFNSSEVRLKEGIRCAGDSVWNEFQFQWGAIEGLLLHLLHRSIISISIPVRCDWRLTWMSHIPNQRLISIPVRCDWRSARRYSPSCSKDISIPVRCDWRTRYWMSPILALPISIPVRCDWRRQWKLHDSTCPAIFQFQWGAIEGIRRLPRCGPLPGISIPVRCDWRRQWKLHDSTCPAIFQFQWGAIEGIRRLPRCGPLPGISIPVRCDWRY